MSRTLHSFAYTAKDALVDALEYLMRPRPASNLGNTCADWAPTETAPSAQERRRLGDHCRKGTYRAGDRARTGDVQLGKLAFYQLNYARESTST